MKQNPHFKFIRFIMFLLFVLLSVTLILADEPAKPVIVRFRRQAVIANSSNVWSTTEPIPYFFETGGYAVNAEVRQQILDAMKFWSETTCLNFKEDTTRTKGIRFISGGGCFSNLGRWPYGTQSLSLWNYGCNNMNTALHEIEHALGVNHQMTRTDRDSYLTVYEDRIVSGIVSQYQKKPDTQTFGLPYEYGSVMHYTENSAAKNPGQATMEARDKDYVGSLGGHEPSFLDVQIVNLLYKCTSKCSTQLACKNFGYTHPKKCNVCICPEGWGGQLCTENPSGTVALTASTSQQKASISLTGSASNRAKSRAYVITAPTGKRIELKFDTLNTSSLDSSCIYNGIEIKGKKDLRTRGIRLCGSYTPTRSYWSEGNRMVIMAFYYNGTASANIQYRYGKPAMSWISTAWYFIVSLQIHAEPIILVMSASNSAVGTVNPQLTKDKMNRTYTPPPDADPATFINKKQVYWDQQYHYINIPVSCLMGIVYGSYSDRFGRKLPMLVGLVSVMISTSLKMLMYSEVTDWPLEWNYVLASVCGFFGDWSLTMTCVNSYLTDIFPDKKTLSFRMVIVSIIFSIGNLGGAQIADLLLNVVDMIAVMGISLAFTVLSFIYGMIVLRPTKPKHVPLKENDDLESVADEEVPQPTKETILSAIKDAFLSIYHSLKIFVIPRSGHRRLFLYVCFLANFLDQFVFGEEKGLIGTYTQLPPFNWTTHDYATYKSWRPIAQIIGMTVGLALFKKVLKMRDTFCICIAIASMGICVLIIGLAQSSWMIYVSLIPEAFHGLLNPLTYTFMSCIVGPDEIGKAYAISSIAQQIAGFAQTAILQNIYTATVDWYMGFVWLLMAAVSGCAVVLYGFVHVVAKKEGCGS